MADTTSSRYLQVNLNWRGPTSGHTGTMRILTFNVNGIQSLHTKSKSGAKKCAPETNVLRSLMTEQNPDVLCLQEIRCQDTKQLNFYKTWYPYLITNHSTVKKGYSGTAILSRLPFVGTWRGWDRFPDALTAEQRDLPIFQEGRLLTAELADCIVVCCYTPNSQDELARLSSRLDWDQHFRRYLQRLFAETGKPLLVCGDLNCALQDIDIYNPKVHRRSAGFSDEERVSLRETTVVCDLVDTWRHLNPTKVAYSYWSNFFKAREKNRGWRIDYILASRSLENSLVASEVLTEYFGSDHCPVLTEVRLPSLDAAAVSSAATPGQTA